MPEERRKLQHLRNRQHYVLNTEKAIIPAQTLVIQFFYPRKVNTY